MGFRSAPKVVSFYPPGEALTFRNPNNINPITYLKDAYIYSLTYFNRSGGINPKFPEVFKLVTYTLKMSSLGRVEPLGFAKTKLHCIIAILCLGLDLGH